MTGQIKKFEDLSLDDYRRNDPRYQGSNFAKNLKLVQVIAQVANKHDALPAQVALAGCCLRVTIWCRYPGTKKRLSI